MKRLIIHFCQEIVRIRTTTINGNKEMVANIKNVNYMFYYLFYSIIQLACLYYTNLNLLLPDN